MKVTSALANMEISVGRISSRQGQLILESGSDSSIDARVAMDARDVLGALWAFARSPSAWGFVLSLPILWLWRPRSAGKQSGEPYAGYAINYPWRRERK
jgi:hypothetical protein